MASNFKRYFNWNIFDRDRQNCLKNRIFRKIEIRKIGTILTINNSGNFRDRQMSSKNLKVLKIWRSNYPNWTVYEKNALFFRLRNGIKFSKVLQLPEVSIHVV